MALQAVNYGSVQVIDDCFSTCHSMGATLGLITLLLPTVQKQRMLIKVRNRFGAMEKRHVESALVQISSFIALFVFLLILIPSPCETASSCGATRVIFFMFVSTAFGVVVGVLHKKHVEHMAWRERHAPKRR